MSLAPALPRTRTAPFVFSPLSCFFRFVEEWRDTSQTLESTEAKAKDAVGRKGMVDASHPPSISFSLFLFLSLPTVSRFLRVWEKDGDRRSEREMDKRVVLILAEPLALPSCLIPAPFHYHDKPQSFVRGFRPFSYFLYPPRRSSVLSLLVHIFFSTHDNWPLENNEFRSVPPEPFANVTQIDLELETRRPERLLSFFYV